MNTYKKVSKNTQVGMLIKNLIQKIKLNNLKGLTFYVFQVFFINTFLRKHQIKKKEIIYISKTLQNDFIVFKVQTFIIIVWKRRKFLFFFFQFQEALDDIYCIRRKGMENDFKINVYFNDEGEEIEKILAFYLRNLLENKIA